MMKWCGRKYTHGKHDWVDGYSHEHACPGRVEEQSVLFAHMTRWPTTLSEVVGEAVGAASVCWESLADAGVFNDAQAKVIVDEVVGWVERFYTPRGVSTPPPTIKIFGKQCGKRDPHVAHGWRNETDGLYECLGLAAEPDGVNHPPHYNDGPVHSVCGQLIECIDVVERMGFRVGNVVKYLWRAGKKGSALQDAHKAQWYLTREIDVLAEKENTDG